MQSRYPVLTGLSAVLRVVAVLIVVVALISGSYTIVRHVLETRRIDRIETRIEVLENEKDEIEDLILRAIEQDNEEVRQELEERRRANNTELARLEEELLDLRLSNLGDSPYLIPAASASIVASFVVAVVLYAFGELLILAVDVANHTRTTAELVRQSAARAAGRSKPQRSRSATLQEGPSNTPDNKPD